MQQHDQQRLIGVGAILLISVIFLPLLFYHSLPGFRKVSLSVQTPEVQHATTVVYQLPLAPADAPENKPPAALTAVSAVPKQLTTSVVHSPTPVVKKAVRVVSSQGQDSVSSPSVFKKKPANVNWQRELNHSIPDAWVVQVASFSDLKNATKLVAVLREKGLLVYTKQQKLATSTITRVFVGPYIDREKAKLLQQHLGQHMQLNGVILKYTS